MNTKIRRSIDEDRESLTALYPAAFPDEDLLPLISELMIETESVLSLVAIQDNVVIGHAAFSTCSIDGSTDTISLLGPVTVSPKNQKQGIGSKLIQEGLTVLKANGMHKVCVLGDPTYYSRFGFNPETVVTPPYDLPSEWNSAWQSVILNDAQTNAAGNLKVPPPWQQSTLWLP